MRKKLADIGEILQAVWPMAKNAIKSGQVFKPQCELTEADEDILCEYDVEIPMSGGFSVTANIYRSKAAAAEGVKVPVIMCAHPYDASLTPALKKTPMGGPPQQYRVVPQAGRPKFSKLTSWEAPDPDFWVPSGYAVVNMNLPGYASSGGSPSIFSEDQAKCYYEAIEWVAARDWCTGKVGLNGVSYLAITQYHVAACQYFGGPPPSLCCISPWEGLTDQYHDTVCMGGVEEIGFPPFWWQTEVKTTINTPESEFIRIEGCLPDETMAKHPFYDDFWKSKAPRLNEITLPMLVCGSFADHGLHTMGSFRAFEKVQSEHKWVYTHRTGKWDAYYSDEVKKLTREFMDCFLKEDSPKDFLQTPRVRLEVRKSRDKIHEVRFENDWPIERTRYRRLYLNSGNRALSLTPPGPIGELNYPARNGRVQLTHTFEEGTELTGYMKLRLWVEARSLGKAKQQPDDMAICVAVNKLDQFGVKQDFYGCVGNKKDSVTRGFCRVSRRELDLGQSTEWNPVLTGTSEKKLNTSEIVPVDIALYPSSTFFEAGESLELIISSSEIILSPPFKKDLSCNSGEHVLHMGGQYDSYLLVPEVPIDDSYKNRVSDNVTGRVAQASSH
jgi:putative CocE/NonD family hydrolase